MKHAFEYRVILVHTDPSSGMPDLDDISVLGRKGWKAYAVSDGVDPWMVWLRRRSACRIRKEVMKDDS